MSPQKSWSADDELIPVESKPPLGPWDVLQKANIPVSASRRRRTLVVLIVALSLIIVIVLVVLAATGVFNGGNEEIPSVTVRNGTILGRSVKRYDQEHYRGIPFAAPPTGNLRFRNPETLAEGWGANALQAREHRTACIGYTQGALPQSEDCLYLNIVRPRVCQGGCAVAVWIHGGGYSSGSPTDPRYDMSFMVQQGVEIGRPIIGVTIAYRLSIWGFLYSDQAVEDGDTNMGLRDQRAALRWIQENIASFGGDPDKVTIMGESAGASSVGYHLVAYGGRDERLFRAAVMQSGSPVFYGSINRPEELRAAYDTVAAGTGCDAALDSLQCLREQPMERIDDIVKLNSSLLLIWNPIIDGDLIQKHASAQLSRGEFVTVPIIAGVNADEGSTFSPYGIHTDDEFLKAITSKHFVEGVSDDLAQNLSVAYPDDPSRNIPASLSPTFQLPDQYGRQWRRAATYYGDVTFHANKRLTCQSWVSRSVPAYCYLFDARANFGDDNAFLGVMHFMEVPFVFYDLQGTGYAPPRPFQNRGRAYRDLARLMCRSWVSFVDGLDPNGFRAVDEKAAELEAWPRYAEGGKNFVFRAETPSGVEVDDYRADGIALINADPANDYNR